MTITPAFSAFGSIVLVLSILAGSCAQAAEAADARTGPLERRWYTGEQLLSTLSKRDHVRWAMPQTISGMGLVGGDQVSARSAVEDFCKQAHLGLTEHDGIWLIHRPADEALAKWTKLLAAGGEPAQAAAWELGWLGDARAIAPLADALYSKEPTVALAAAQGLDVLLTDVPLGQTERVDAPQAGRVPLARAFAPAADFSKLLSSPYPPVRAAALRIILSLDPENEVAKKWQQDRSVLVQRVWQQMHFKPPVDKGPQDPPDTTGPKNRPLAPLPKSDEAVKLECAKIMGELPALEKRSEWEEMRYRARVISDWSNHGSAPATDALIQLCQTQLQYGWYPAYVQMLLADTGSEKATAHLKSIMPKAGRDTLVRGLERGRCGDDLLAFTRPFLNEQTVCYVTTRKAGRVALNDLLAALKQLNTENGDYSLLDALGTIGGPQATDALIVCLGRDEESSATMVFRAAKALGQAGNASALKALLAATGDPERMRRHAATLFLGRIGGPDAISKLLTSVEKDPDRMVRAAAAEALEQINAPEALASIKRFRDADAAMPVLEVKPRNARFGPDFPTNKWVNLKIPILAYDNYGEVGWNYDAADHLFFRYGGCSGYTNELTLFDLGTERFVQRVPNEEMAGWGERRPPRGCSGGRTWDPIKKVAWIGPSIGGSEADLAIDEYYNKNRDYRFCSYDLATDRFKNSEYHEATYGEPSQRYAFDWKNALLYPVKSSPFPEEKPFWAMNARTAGWEDRSIKGDGAYPRFYSYGVAAVDQDAGLLVLYIASNDKQSGGKPHTWVYDPTTRAWKEMHPAAQPVGQTGAAFAYDPYHKVLLLQSGEKEYQYGGDADSITWTYDVRTNTWTDLKPPGGPGNAWMGAMDFDPEHNVFVLFNNRDRQVWAYRMK